MQRETMNRIDTNPRKSLIYERDRKKEEIKTFETFDKCVRDLDQALRIFGSSVQLLGSSVGMLNATYHLRKSLLRFQYYFRENAASIFSDVGRNEIRDISLIKPRMKVRGRLYTATAETRTDENTNNMSTNKKGSSKDKSNLQAEMKRLAEGLKKFLERVNDMSEFEDELLNKSFGLFAEDLEYRHEALGSQQARGSDPAFQRHIHKISGDFTKYIKSTVNALENYREHGVPAIREAQAHAAQEFQSLSAVATFFSGVTASTIQYSVGDTSGSLHGLVNGFWIMSLALSIASAVSAQVAARWRTSQFSSPLKYGPVFMTYWLNYLPLVYLTCSVFAFLVGLCAFTYSSSQPLTISILVTLFTVMIGYQLMYMAVWFALDRWAYSKSKGTHWFFQIFQDKLERLWEHSPRLRRLPWFVLLPLSIVPLPYVRKPTKSAQREMPNFFRISIDPPESQVRKFSSLDMSASKSPTRGQIICRKIVDLDRQGNLPSRGYWTVQGAAQMRPGPSPLSAKRVQPYANMALKFQPSMMYRHSRLVKHLAFSPDGSRLATCGDGIATVWNMTGQVQLVRTFHHIKSNPLQYHSIKETSIKQVLWSPNGKYLATRNQKTLQVWEVDLGRSDPVMSWEWPMVKGVFTWLPSSTALVYAEYMDHRSSPLSNTTIFTIIGLNTSSPIPGQNLSRIDVTSMVSISETRLIIVGSWRPNQNRPKFPLEAKLILYDIGSGQIEHQVPLPYEARSISISKTKGVIDVLVMYKRSGAHPQAWRINLNPGSSVSGFGHVRTYYIPGPSTDQPDFSGWGGFGGCQDEYICCSSQVGEVFVWNRQTGHLICTVDPQNDEQIKHFACNRSAHPEFLFVSGAVNGSVCIWSDPTSTLQLPLQIKPTEMPKADPVKAPEHIPLDAMES